MRNAGKVDAGTIRQALDVLAHIWRLPITELDIRRATVHQLLSIGYKDVGDILSAGELELRPMLYIDDVDDLKAGLSKLGLALYPRGISRSEKIRESKDARAPQNEL